MNRVGIWSRLLGITFVFTFLDVGIFQVLGIFFPNLDENVETNLGRALFALACLAVIYEFLPGGKKFYRLPQASLRGWLFIGFTFLLFLLPGYLHGELPTESFGRFFDVLLFCVMIGVAEEILCRGLVFQMFTRIGFWTAVHVSSVSFGLMHFYNLNSGRNLTFTIYQVIDAGIFGYFAVGLMIYTGSIWVPVVFHGLYNVPVVTIDDLGMGDISYSWVDAVAVVTHGVTMVSLGLVMIWARYGWPRFMHLVLERVKELAEKYKLIESQ